MSKQKLSLNQLNNDRDTLASARELYEAIKDDMPDKRTCSVEFRPRSRMTTIIPVSDIQHELLMVCTSYLSSRITALELQFHDLGIDPDIRD
jgi:hypothetical protein